MVWRVGLESTEGWEGGTWEEEKPIDRARGGVGDGGRGAGNPEGEGVYNGERRVEGEGVPGEGESRALGKLVSCVWKLNIYSLHFQWFRWLFMVCHGFVHDFVCCFCISTSRH